MFNSIISKEKVSERYRVFEKVWKTKASTNDNCQNPMDIDAMNNPEK